MKVSRVEKSGGKGRRGVGDVFVSILVSFFIISNITAYCITNNFCNRSMVSVCFCIVVVWCWTVVQNVSSWEIMES